MKRSFWIACIVGTCFVAYVRAMYHHLHRRTAPAPIVAAATPAPAIEAVPEAHMIRSTVTSCCYEDAPSYAELKEQNRILHQRLMHEKSALVILGSVHKGSQIGYAVVGDKVCFSVDGQMTKGCLTIKN